METRAEAGLMRFIVLSAAAKAAHAEIGSRTDVSQTCCGFRFVRKDVQEVDRDYIRETGILICPRCRRTRVYEAEIAKEESQMATETKTPEARAATYARLIHVEVEKIADNPYQPRATIAEGPLEELSVSIRVEVGPVLTRLHDMPESALTEAAANVVLWVLRTRDFDQGIPTAGQAVDVEISVEKEAAQVA